MLCVSVFRVRASGFRQTDFSGAILRHIYEYAVRTKPPAAADATRCHAQTSFLLKVNRGSIGSVMIAKRLFANLGFIQVEELLLTQGVRLLSP